MKQPNVSTKITAPILVWVSVILTAACLAFSFMPLMCLDTSIAGESIEELFVELEIVDEVEIPEKVEISAVKIINAVSVFGKVIKVASQQVNSMAENPNMTPEQQKKADEAEEELRQTLLSDKGKESILVATSIITTISNSTELGDNAGIISIIVNCLIAIFAIFYSLTLMFLIPIKLIIMMIKALIISLKNVKTPELAQGDVSGQLPKLLSIPLSLMIIQTFLPGMTYGWGVMAIVITIITAVLFSTVVSRLHTYEEKHLNYINIIQGVSVVSIVGYCVFFINILNTNVLSRFLKGKLSDTLISLANVAEINMNIKNPEDKIATNNLYLIDVVLILIFFSLLLSSISYIANAVKRLSCSIERKKAYGKLADSAIVQSVILIAIYIIPKYIMGAKHYFNDITSTESVGDASFLVLEANEEKALTAAFVGLIIMLVSEIAILVLKGVFCKGMTTEESGNILSGNAQEEKKSKKGEKNEEVKETEEAEVSENV